MSESALTLITRLSRQIDGLITALDIDLIGRETGKTLVKIRQLSQEARLDVRDWEMSETRTEMNENSRMACQRMDDLRKHVLKASEHGIFSTVDVVHISAQLDTIGSMLQ